MRTVWLEERRKMELTNKVDRTLILFLMLLSGYVEEKRCLKFPDMDSSDDN